GGPDSDNAGDKACRDEYPHRFLLCFAHFKSGFAWNERHPESGLSRKGKGCGLDVHESPSQRADAGVKISRSGVLKIDKKASDPRSEMLIEEVALGAGWTGDIAADKARHAFAKERGMML